MQKNIFIFDQNKCVGCHACVVACMNENEFQEPKQWRNVFQSQDIHFPELPLFHLSIACNHCDDAPCLKNCPALAYSRDKNTGAVIHDPEKCIGCKYCTWACPYDAPKFNPKTGIIEKCTFCNHRIEENLKPSCAGACPVNALEFTKTEFSEQESAQNSPVPVQVGSHIKINKLRNTSGPEMDLSLFKNQPTSIVQGKKHQKISAKEEWPLIIFTLLSAALVSLYTSGITDSFNFMHKIIYVGFGALAAILSMLHLGQKSRAWRSLTNIKDSWLSKEIGLFLLFFTGVFCDFFLFNIPNYIVFVIGILFLFAIDLLYRIATWRWYLKIHSAQTILIGITLFAFLTNSYYLLAFIISFRLTIYSYKKYTLDKNDWIISSLRIILPVLSYVLIYSFQETFWALLLLASGEIIDRIEFYNELNVPNPKTEFTNQILKFNFT